MDVRQANIPNDVADWLKEQVEEARLAIVVLGLQRCLEVLRQNEQRRRRFGATLRVGAFRWDAKDDRTTYRAFLRAVQEQLPEYAMPSLSDVDMALSMHDASYGLIGYTMKLKESGTPLLAIPDPDPGRGHAYFLREDVGAQIRLPTRRMLREESQRRMKAERKRKRAEYRLARESATGKPMRRTLRPSCSGTVTTVLDDFCRSVCAGSA